MALGVSPSLWQRLRDLAAAIEPLRLSFRSMTFSQYGEDRMLGISLFPTGRGVYVDVGAFHPWRASNTYKLYLKGWRGLTIEPNPEYARHFRKLRPRDIHLTVGVGREPGEFEYYEFEDRKLNTFSAETARYQASQGWRVTNTRRLCCTPLQGIVDEHLEGAQIDLLSVDCEGHDLDVLRSLDFSRTRPTAVLVEDFVAFEGLGTGRRSEILNFLSAVDYRPIGQCMFSSLYIDNDVLASGRSEAYDLAMSQVGLRPGAFTDAAPARAREATAVADRAS